MLVHLVNPEILRLILGPRRKPKARLAACRKTSKGLGNVGGNLMWITFFKSDLELYFVNPSTVRGLVFFLSAFLKKQRRFTATSFESILWIRLQRWSFFSNDAMVMIFFQGTIANDGFSMVFLPPDHHH